MIFGFDRNKSPRLDGFSMAFFQDIAGIALRRFYGRSSKSFMKEVL